jgi:hypothetical protein
MKQHKALHLADLMQAQVEVGGGDLAEIEEAAAELRRLHEANQIMLEALTKIERWSSHTTQMAVDHGSNGVRDLYRAIASSAIAKATGEQA